MAMYQVYDALRGLTDECVSVYLGDILVYSLTMAARRTHLWMVLDWMLESRLHVCAGVSDFWSVRCHYKCVLTLECVFSLVAASCSQLLADHPQFPVETEMASRTQI